MLRLIIALLLFSAVFVNGQQQPTGLRSHAPRLPNVILLTGNDDGGFFLTNGNSDLPFIPYSLSRAPFITSRDGLVLVAEDTNQQFAVYQLNVSKWATLKNQCNGLGAISPDDMTLACLDYHPSSDRLSFTINLKFINLANGQEEEGRQFDSGPTMEATRVKASNLPPHAAVTGQIELRNMDWSPDGKQIVFERWQQKLRPAGTDANGYVNDFRESAAGEIRIIDVSTGAVKKLADGYAPSWSPSGEWIAFSDARIKQLYLVHPDGTDLHPVARLRKDYLAIPPAVWSPDSRQLILNQWWDIENGAFATDLVDLDSLKSKTLIKNTYQVYRWLSRLPQP